jgi:hypothetical protein
MVSLKRSRVFNPLDLEIIDCVYEAAWAELEARDPFRDTEKDGELRQALRKLVMNNTGMDKVDFDTLYDRVLANMPETWPAFTAEPRSMQEAG